mmetsp:Transcript_14905/g.19560  ORF Transcript_14905/g.19560 Transcript_14905/m.19560 type:complete len:328 (-) Transcript_14905:117-1100(-)
MKSLLGELKEVKEEESEKDGEKKDKKKKKRKEDAESKQPDAKKKKQDEGDIELGNIKTGKFSPFMESFFKDVEQVRQAIEFLSLKTKLVVQLSEKAEKAIGQEPEKQCSDELQVIMKESNHRCKVTKEILSRMKKGTDKLLSEKKVKQSEIRIRRNLHQTYTQKFVQVVREYQQSQQQYKIKMKEKVARQVRLAKPEATYEEIDQTLRSGDTNAVYRAAILQDSADPVSEAYLNVADKYQDVLKLEQSILQLHEMFVDLALLVEQQGEILDKIEFSVNAAEKYVEEGNDELRKALVARKALRRKYFILFLIIATILTIILGSVFGSG